ncbi:MAG: primosomal protein N' [Candidatus Saccharibacteria bacterium]|nr:primosomal protein N' [Candidatus Saccharibacteria bacterium]
MIYYYEVSPTTVVRADQTTFTYSSDEELATGAIVTVPVGTKQLTGVVMYQVAQPAYAVKPITRVLPQPPLPLPLIATAQWMSQYYATHLATVWQTVLPRGVTKKRRTTTSSAATPDVAPERTQFLFTPEQQTAIDAITAMHSGTTLLHGVTGSGKTAVYIAATERALQDGLSVIILVPEIALTSQLVTEFSQHFPHIVLTHSRQTEAERHRLWLEVLRAREPVVVIGPRSALFMPVQQLGLIVIDECHEPSFKQEQSPRYSALRVGAVLAQQHEAVLVLGSATPLITDYYTAEHAHRPILTMTKPARTDTVKPTVKLIDMTKRHHFVRHYFLSDELLAALEATFAAGKQALIFHNRRGTASVTLCETCGWSAGCPRCFVPLTLHADHHRLSCHICAAQLRVPTSCPECGAAEIIHKGIGTKRIEAELRRLFPNKKIARFDADTTAGDGVDQRYNELKSGAIDLIIGTQVIAKGLDLPHLRTVGVIQADAGLNLPDFSSAERTFQLLAQVVGRVGRSHHPTTVIVQTFQPDHPAITDGLAQAYDDFYRRTITQRRATGFPPFMHLLKLTCTYKSEATAIRNAKALATTLKTIAPEHVHILGPTPAFYERVRDSYRWQLTVKSPHRHDLLALLTHIPPRHWQFELDPTTLL